MVRTLFREPKTASPSKVLTVRKLQEKTLHDAKKSPRASSRALIETTGEEATVVVVLWTPHPKETVTIHTCP
jgi:hypothetical protein